MPRLKLSYRLATFTAITIIVLSLTAAGSNTTVFSFVDSVKEFFGIATTISVLAEQNVDVIVAPTPEPLAPLANQFFAGDGSTLTAAKWGPDGGAYTSTFTAGNVANFNVVDGIGSGAAGITISGIVATENFTYSSPSGTLATGGTVVPITVSSGKVLNLSTIAFSTAAGTGFSKSGSGVLFTGNGNTYPAGFTLNQGTIVAGGVNAMGAGGANTLVINGGAIAGNASRDFTGKYPGGITVSGDFQLGELVSNVALSSSSANLTFSNNVNLGAVTRTITVGANGIYSIGGVISGTTGSGVTIINAAGASGTLSFTGLNTYTGATTLSGGTISVATIRDGGIAGGLGQASNAAANLVFDGGTLRYTGSTASTNRNFTINPGKTATIGVSVTGDLTLSGTSGSTTGGLTKIDTGLLFLSGTNLYTGNTTIAAGSLALTGSGSIATSPVIDIQGGAYFDVSSLSNALTLANGQAIKASGTTTTGRIATVSGKGLTTAVDSPLQFTAFNGATPPLTISGSGAVTLESGNPVTVNTTAALGVGDYILIAKGTGGGSVAGTAPTSLTVGGSGLASGTIASLQITGSQLVLSVAAAPPTLQFSSSNPTGSEAGPITITVTRAGSSANTISVGYETLGGGAACTAGVDFLDVSGTLTFVTGDNSETFDIPTCDDNIYEGTTEGFQVRLINPSGATLGVPNDVIFNINENDLVPSVQFSSATYTNNDDLSLNTGKTDPLAPQIATITATRSGAAGNAFSVNYATAIGGTATGGANCGTGSGVDYVSTSGTLNFAAGDTSKTFNVTVCTDDRYEGDETVNLALTSPTAPATLGTLSSSVLTITDNDSQPSLQFSSATYSNSDDIAKFGVTTEDLTAVGAIITVNRTGAVDNAVTVDYTTGGGTATAGVSCTTGVDYVTASGTLTFAAGVISQTFNVPVCTDTLFEGNETVDLTLSNPTGLAALGTPNSAVLTIIDNDPAPTSATNLSAPETYTEDTTLNLTDIVVSDADSANVTATLTLSNTSAGSLTTATSDPVTSTFSAGVWSASGPIANVNTLLAAVSFVPATNFNASFTIDTAATDGVTTPATGSKAMTGVAVNDGPIATNLSASESYTEDTTLNLTDIVVTDVDSASVTATLTLSNTLAGGLSTATSGAVTSTYVAGTGVWTASGAIANVNALLAGVSFVPTANFNGSFTIGTSVTDGVAAPSTGTKSVTGIAVNDAPIATNLSASESYTEDTTLNLTDIVVTDPDSSVTATLTLSNPSAGSLTTATFGPVTSTFSSGVWTASGPVANVNTLLAGVSFVPAANFNGGFTIGTSVSDGVAAPSTGTKSVTGVAVNDPPIAVDDNRTTIQDVALVVTGASLVSNDLDPDGPSLTVTAVSNPVNGTVGLSAGTITFTPNAGYIGSASFEYTVSDGTLSDTGVVNITVTAADVTAPVVTYTPIPNSSLNPTLSVTATDAVGVTGVTIFWSINGGSFSSAGCGFVSGTTWNCAIAGMISTSSVAYYVTAQDAAANTSTNPVGGAASPNLFTYGPATVPAGTYENVSLGGGVALGGNITVNGSLTLNGIVTTGANKISVACGVPVVGASPASYVVGNFERFFCGVETFTFPVGGPILPPFSPEGTVVGNYSPLTAQITAGTVGSSLTVSVTDDFLPGSHTSFSASRYWSITENGSLTANLIFAYLDQDISGDETTYRILRRSGSTIGVYLNGTVNPATNTVTANGVSDFSGWAAGNLAPTAANVSLGGRILTADGLGVTNAIVVVSGNSLATPIRAVTGPFGYYQFDGLAVGETYVVTVNSKRFTFQVPSRVVSLTDNALDIDFVASPLE